MRRRRSLVYLCYASSQRRFRFRSYLQRNCPRTVTPPGKTLSIPHQSWSLGTQKKKMYRLIKVKTSSKWKHIHGLLHNRRNKCFKKITDILWFGSDSCHIHDGPHKCLYAIERSETWNCLPRVLQSCFFSFQSQRKKLKPYIFRNQFHRIRNSCRHVILKP